MMMMYGNDGMISLRTDPASPRKNNYNNQAL